MLEPSHMSGGARSDVSIRYSWSLQRPCPCVQGPKPGRTWCKETAKYPMVLPSCSCFCRSQCRLETKADPKGRLLDQIGHTLEPRSAMPPVQLSPKSATIQLNPLLWSFCYQHLGGMDTKSRSRSADHFSWTSDTSEETQPHTPLQSPHSHCSENPNSKSRSE